MIYKTRPKYVFDPLDDTRLNFNEGYVDKGSVGSGTSTVDVTAGGWQRIQATGDFTLAFSNIPAAGTAWHVTIEAVNWDAHTITLPAALDTPGGAGLTTTASGTDLIEFGGRNSTTLFHAATAFEDTK